jgi:hypothetical protein
LLRGSALLEYRPAARMRQTLAEAGRADRVADELLFAAPEGGTGTLATSDPTDLSRALVCEGEFESEARVALDGTLAAPIPTGIDLVTPQRIRGFLSTGERQFPLVGSACEFEWSIEFTLPASHTIVRVPGSREIANAAGRYSSRAEPRSNHTVLVTRTLRIEKDRFTAAETPQFQALLRELLADHHAVVIARESTN